MYTSNSKHGNFLFLKMLKILTQKGEHSCKCTELSLKRKECIGSIIRIAILFQFTLIDQNSNQEVYSWESDPYELHDRWIRQCYDLPPGLRLRAWFTSIRTETSTYGVDIGIDDVTLNAYRCDGKYG